jgi:hypothetical protein
MAKSIPLTPPSAYRQRVVAPEFLKANEHLIRFQIDQILQQAQRNASTTAVEWAEEIVKLQKAGKLPSVTENLVAAAEIGVACTEVESTMAGFNDSETPYLIHACMAMISYSDNPAETVIQAAAIDGAYYIERMKTPAEVLAESFTKSI